MFHDYEGRFVELFDQVDRRVDVEHVVVRDVLAVQFVEQSFEVAVEDGRLVGILPVAQRRSAVETQLERADLFLAVEIVEDGRIVVRADVERIGCETTALFERRSALLGGNDFVEFGVLVDRRYDHHVLEVFRCGADQRGAPDVDFFDHGLLFGPRSDGLFEGIEVDDHRVDFRDLVLSGLFGVLRIVAAGEDPSENFRMERFHASAEDRRIPRQALDRHGFQTESLDERKGSAGRIDRYAVLR